MQILYSNNPLNPYAGCKKYTLTGIFSPNSIVKTLFTRLARPTILFVNGELWERKRWGASLHPESDVMFVELPQGTTAYMVITLLIAVGSFVYSLVNTPSTPKGGEDAGVVQKQTYSFSDGANSINIGNPFVEQFGRMRCFPDLLQQPFVKNERIGADDANYQHLYFLGIIGVGGYEIEDVYIGNTPLTNYENSEYRIFGPNETIEEEEDGELWNIITADYDGIQYGVGSDVYGICFNSDGTKMYTLNFTSNEVRQHTLSSAWDLSTASYDSVYLDFVSETNDASGLFFSADGSKLYILETNSDVVLQYTLSTPWDLSTASYASLYYDVTSEDGFPVGVFFNSDGTKMFILGQTSEAVYQYTLSTAWNVSTASYDSVFFDISSQVTTTPQNLYFSTDGTKMYIVASNRTHQYNLSAAWNLSDVGYVNYYSVNGTAISFKSDGTKLYVKLASSSYIRQYSIIAYEASINSIVYTCNEVEQQELLTDDWITYIISAPNTEIGYVEYDILFRNGLTSSCQWTVELRTIDAAGAATSEWTIADSRTQWGSSTDPQRYSYKVSVPHGVDRYQFRIQGVESSFSPELTGLRGYGPPHPDYGDVTVLFARIKATDKLNGNVASQINVVATRKLGTVTSGGVGATLTATRSIIDAIGYLLTSSNCGNQSDSLIDWDTLSALRATFASDGYYFDHRFSSRVSVMDAVATAAACGRAVPYMPGGIFSVVQDVDQEIPTCVFTDDNITGLTITTNPKTADLPTCVNISYIDPDTWDEKTITCFDAYGSADRPTEINLEGCTTRQQAYEIGMFLYLQGRLERTFVSFVTNASGYIPQLLSKVLVPNKMTNWGASGLVVKVDESTIWLSEPVDFDGWSSGLLYITLEDGTAGGPYTVEPTDYSHAVTGSIPVLNTLNADGLAATRFLFGVDADEKLLVRITNITPQGRDSIKISGTIVAHEIYEDQGTAPAEGEVTWNQGLLDAINLVYLGEDSSDHEFYLTWLGSADNVLIELDEGDSSGYTTLVDGYASYGYLFSSDQDIISVRVTPYDESDLETGSAIETTWDYSDVTGESS